MQLISLVDCPEHFPLVAQWNWDEWSHLLNQRSAAEFEQWLRENLQPNRVPMTLLAIEEGRPVGTVSLIDHDLEPRPELSPWLASLYVIPSERGRGLGKWLVGQAEDKARELGLKQLHLYTPGQEPFYAALGWERVELYPYRGEMVAIMRRSMA